MNLPKISATIITFNEEENIERCLQSIKWIDEIVVVDSFSTDSTLEICNKYNCNIIQTEWKGFGKTKKFAVDNSKNEWILSIDADEEVSEELKERILNITGKEKYNGYKIKRRSFYLGKEIKHCGWDRDYPLRLFNKNAGNFNEKEVHESVKIDGEKGRLEEPIYHYTYPDIATHVKKMNRYSDLGQSEIKSKNGYGIIASLLLGINKFIKMYFIQKGFLDGKIGFLLSIHSAFGVYLKYIKTWQKKN